MTATSNVCPECSWSARHQSWCRYYGTGHPVGAPVKQITDASHAMLDRAFARDDRDLLLCLRDRLRAVQKSNDPMYATFLPARAFASELLALFPDDLL